jgi:hypothetical protein
MSRVLKRAILKMIIQARTRYVSRAVTGIDRVCLSFCSSQRVVACFQYENLRACGSCVQGRIHLMRESTSTYLLKRTGNLEIQQDSFNNGKL